MSNDDERDTLEEQWQESELRREEEAAFLAEPCHWTRHDAPNTVIRRVSDCGLDLSIALPFDFKFCPSCGRLRNETSKGAPKQ